MDAVELLKSRRSIRKFKEQKVDRETMKEIIDIARWAPSWANYQIARYTLVDDPETIRKLSTDGVKGFVYNVKTIENAKGVAILSFVQGKSGKIDADKIPDFDDSRAHVWEVFDAGIACQTFCLAAHAKGVGTTIFGIIDEQSISEIINLPADETVGALIVYGYPDEAPQPTPRKEAADIVRFI